MKNITIWDRLRADTPSFFKRAQIFGAGLVALAVSLTQINGIPERIVTILSTVGATITAISQFAIKQYDMIEEDDSLSK